MGADFEGGVGEVGELGEPGELGDGRCVRFCGDEACALFVDAGEVVQGVADARGFEPRAELGDGEFIEIAEGECVGAGTNGSEERGFFVGREDWDPGFVKVVCPGSCFNCFGVCDHAEFYAAVKASVRVLGA